MGLDRPWSRLEIVGSAVDDDGNATPDPLTERPYALIRNGNSYLRQSARGSENPVFQNLPKRTLTARNQGKDGF
ncbi:MAG: hypothetical protein ACR2PX_09380, partial [Endozoicomonas sp.]|uniref:hypothetical protein n=1 Tax=Endozoicomonas sp. TaxID=1892382 RepID=UPI003D9AE24D